MKVKVLETGAATRTLEIEVPVEKVAEELEEHYSRLARRAKLPGFRAGKIPRPILEKNFRPQVEQEVVNHLVPEATLQALEESKLEVVGSPRIEGLQFQASSGMQFKALVEVKPAFELSGPLTGLKVKAPKAEVAEQEVERQLGLLAESQSILGAPIERPAQKGDQATIDFQGTVDGNPFEGGKAKGYPLVLGSGSTIPGFEDAILGAAAGSKVTAKVKFPEDYHAKEMAGKDAEFAIHVKEVRERKPAALDDELAKQAGDFQDLAGLKARIRETLDARAKAERKAQVVGQLSEQLVKAHAFQAPAAMVEGELRYLLDREKQRLQRQGLQLTSGEEKLLQEMRPLAESRSKLSLILSKLAAREGISVTDEEYRAEMGRIAPGLGMGTADAIRWASENGREAGFKAKLVEDKAMEWVFSKAEITED
jgi:trigger factor